MDLAWGGEHTSVSEGHFFGSAPAPRVGAGEVRTGGGDACVAPGRRSPSSPCLLNDGPLALNAPNISLCVAHKNSNCLKASWTDDANSGRVSASTRSEVTDSRAWYF